MSAGVDHIGKDCPVAILRDYALGIGISASRLPWFTSGSRAALPNRLGKGCTPTIGLVAHNRPGSNGKMAPTSSWSWRSGFIAVANGTPIMKWSSISAGLPPRDRLSRDLWPSLCALDGSRLCHFVMVNGGLGGLLQRRGGFCRWNHCTHCGSFFGRDYFERTSQLPHAFVHASQSNSECARPILARLFQES